MIGRRKQMAMAAVIDVALHARGKPVPARALADRHGLAPRHLEPLLQDLVRANILKGTRGPRGGYELARERRRITAGDVLRALDRDDDAPEYAASPLLVDVVAPAVREASDAFLATLDRISLADLCRNAETRRLATGADRGNEFHI
jgi:Rrf2 family transcriptional regulator, iron-sulfur cluster assembly transcription factor